jgi:hypothetical protein
MRLMFSRTIWDLESALFLPHKITNQATKQSTNQYGKLFINKIQLDEKERMIIRVKIGKDNKIYDYLLQISQVKCFISW